MEYHFRVFEEEGTYWAKCVELEGCQSQGRTMRELESNLHEALNLYLDEPADSKRICPFPKKRVRGAGILRVPVEERVAFAFLLRQLRLRHKLTQKEMARKMGVKSLYSYQRLEDSRKANPALETLAKIKAALPEFSVDAVFQDRSHV